LERFASQADIARFLAPHPIFARDKKGNIHPQRIRNMLTNTLYAGSYEHKDWGIPLTKGNHPAIITWETFQRNAARLAEGSQGHQKTASLDDFPLRGTIACAACGHPMTGYWAKGRSKRYAYYECFQKGCDQRRKSIKRADVDKDFQALLTALTPNKALIAIACAMFKDIWDQRSTQWQAQRKAQKAELTRIEIAISKAADRLIDLTSAAAERALEANIYKLEAQRVALAENLAQTKPSPPDLPERF